MTTQELKQYIDKVLGSSIRCLLPSYWWKRIFGLIVDEVDTVSKSVATMNKDINEKLENMSSYEEITYAELYKKQYNAELIPNRLYRITDYRCSLGPQVKNAVVADYDQFKNFNIIVKALTKSRLDENARATDVVGTSTGYNKASWEIKYSMENDKDKFPWANFGDLEVDISVVYETQYGTTYRNFIWVEENKRYEANRHIYINTNVSLGVLVTSLSNNDTLGKTAFNKGDKVYVLENGQTYVATVLYTKGMKDTGEGVLISNLSYDGGINGYEAYVWNSTENAYIGIKQGRKLCGEDQKILEKRNSFEPCMPVLEYYLSDSGVHIFRRDYITVGFNIPHGTGVIYYMKDDNNNVAFYDFKQIKFLIPGEDRPRFTFENYSNDGFSSYGVFANNYIENCGNLNGVSFYSKGNDIKFKNNYIASTVTDVCFKQSLSNKHIGTDSEGNTQTINIFDADAKAYDSELSETSTNAVQNKVVTAKLIELSGRIDELGEGVEGPQGPVGPQGPQGNSGYTGAADELEVVNNLTQGGATAALSAEMGKVLAEKAYEGWELAILANDRLDYLELDIPEVDLSDINKSLDDIETGMTALEKQVDADIEVLNGRIDTTDAQLTELSAEIGKKQDTITDLETIRSGAAKGATAIQEVKTINGQSIIGEGDITIEADVDTSNLATKVEVNAKQDKINDLETIRSGATLGASALQSHQDISHLATKEDVLAFVNEFVANEEVYAAAVNDLNARVNSNYLYGEDTYVTKEAFNTAVQAINTAILDNEEVIAATLADLNAQITALRTQVESLTNVE